MIKRIYLENFRVFDECTIDTNYPLIIFSGKNATGKTSILEAIFLCATSKSHRTNEIETLIQNGKEYAICEIETPEKVKMVLSKEGKTSFLNKKEVKKISDFIGSFTVVMFSPLDVRLISGTKQERRHFLDMEISLLDKVYLKNLLAYKKILKDRNEILKQNELDKIGLEVLTNQLIEYLEKIYLKRVEFIERLNINLQKISEQMEIESIRVEYKKTYEEDIYQSFKNKEKLDILNKMTTLGIHRDDFIIYMNDTDARIYASEGQVRTICIAIKLAVKEYIEQTTKKDCILLLDDVFAALDKNRIMGLTKYVGKSTQTFITTTSILEIPDELLKKANVIRIEDKEKKHGKQQL